ncbi:MAG: serine acetyltransferase, partial [Thermodesulfobacteriota bacterium]|nr:serine acetyltransferase [Thermodesulfobacteriota bacterium]
MDCPSKMDQCNAEIAKARKFREEIPDVVNQLILTCSRDDCFDHVSPEPISSKNAIIELIERTRRILFPGYFIPLRLDEVNLGYYFGQEVTGLFEALSEQITLSIRHECLRYGHPCRQCDERGQQEAICFIR